MRRIVILASSVWIAVIGSIALFTLFRRVGYLRPHPLWGVLSLVAMFAPMTWLAASALRRIVCGPCRWQAVGWLLVGATPLVWTGAYLTELAIQSHNRTFERNAPARVAMVWVSSMLDVNARWRCPRWTRGRHAVLMDDGRTPSAEKLVAEMDHHIQAMSDLLGQPVPEMEFPWVRGSLFGLGRMAILYWALCGQDENPGELTYLDRHEVAHTVITAISAPHHRPPTLLREGWAESQSKDRNAQIRYLAKKRKEGLAFSLQELVGPDMYERGGPAYWEGGPLVHCLMDRYGPETFFRLYSAARKDSFRDDCRAILGDSWETVEENFWEWLEAEEKLLAEADVQQPDAAPVAHVELAESVDPVDWQALVEGCREANKDIEPLPSNTAFVLEGEQVEGETETPGSAKRTKLEFSAVFEGQQFWIFDNSRYSADWFLMATTARCADLQRNDSGSFEGRVMPGRARVRPRRRASELLALYRKAANPPYLLPVSEVPRIEATYHIERLLRPTEGKTGRWKVWFTRRGAEDDTEVRYEVELDPGQRWWITRIVRERPERQWETDAEYERVGGALMPVTCHARFSHDEGESTVSWRLRPMSEVERQELKQRVEQAVRSGPPIPFQRLRCFLLVIVIACPLVGATLLGVTRRCKPPLSRQPKSGESRCRKETGESYSGEP
ncbi:MAG: hypothetical protein ACYTG0_39535 [Planctomycetota bacterium]|jgi:hypothetical protein